MDAEVARQLAALRITQDEQRAAQEEQRAAQEEQRAALEEQRAAQDAIREQIRALKAHDDMGRLLSPTSIREVMDALRSCGRYTVVPLAKMHLFGWAPAASHIALLDDAALLPMRASGLPSSAQEEPPVTARRVRASEAASGSKPPPPPRRFTASKTATTVQAMSAVWRDAFAGAGAAAVPAQEGLRQTDTGGIVPSGVRSQQLLFQSLPVTSKAGSSVLAEAADLQPWFSRVLPRVNGVSWKVNWVDGHKLNSIGRRKPDGVHYAHRAGDGDGAVQSESNIAYVGDWKGQKATGSGDMTEDELAHMIDFLMELARVQPWRRRFVGYLLDGVYVVFLTATFEPGPARGAPVLTSVLQSVPLRLQGHGGLFLHGLFLADLSATGCDLPRATVISPSMAAAHSVTTAASAGESGQAGPVTLLDVLGVGSTSVVFRARIAGFVCAVKFLQGAGSLAGHELRILRHLRSRAVPGIAGIAYEAVEQSVVITSPVGERLAIRADDVRAALAVHRARVLTLSRSSELRGGWSGEQLGGAAAPILINARIFESVVDSLHSAHCCGVIHGDPRLANLAAVPLSPLSRVADFSGSGAHSARKGPHVAASAASGGSAACEHPPGEGSCAPPAEALFSGLVLDFGYGHIGEQLSTVRRPANSVSEGSDEGWAAAYAFRYTAIGALSGHVWVSLPYASRRQLAAYAKGVTHSPEPADDLFVLCASLYRLLVPWAPAADVQTPEDALLLAAYWDCLMKGGVAGEAAAGRPGLWGQALSCAEAYDVRGFKAAVAGAVQSTVPDWPWVG